MRTSFTLPVLLPVGAYFLDALIQRFRSRSPTKLEVSDASPRKSFEKNGSTRSFKNVWIFLIPGALYVVFTEAMWVHQFQYRYFSLFMAIAAALAILRLRDFLMTRHLAVANITAVVILVTIFGFCTVGLNTYRYIEVYPTKEIEMFETLKSKIKPEQSLLSYESYIIDANPVKWTFYRPEVAWYLDRDIVTARSLPEAQRYVATGRFTYYLIANTVANTGVPLIRVLVKTYN